MESRYGIGVNNRYALFLDSDNEDGDNIEDMMAKKTSISGDNQKKTALKDSQGKTKDDKINIQCPIDQYSCSLELCHWLRNKNNKINVLY